MTWLGLTAWTLCSVSWFTSGCSWGEGGTALYLPTPYIYPDGNWLALISSQLNLSCTSHKSTSPNKALLSIAVCWFLIQLMRKGNAASHSCLRRQHGAVAAGGSGAELQAMFQMCLMLLQLMGKPAVERADNIKHHNFDGVYSMLTPLREICFKILAIPTDWILLS